MRTTFFLLSVTLLGLTLLTAWQEAHPAWKTYEAEFDCLRSGKNGVLPSSKDPGPSGGVVSGLRQIHVPALAVTDRCANCHLGLTEPDLKDAPRPFRAHPGRFLVDHPSERFGCTPCHDGNGLATEVQAAHGRVAHWDRPLLSGAAAASTCTRCHETVRDLPGAERLDQGLRLLDEKGCLGCHRAPGLTRKFGPPLGRVREKLRWDWLVAWLDDPSAYQSRPRMPDFDLSTEDATAMAAFLWSLGGEPPPPVSWPESVTKPEEALTDEEFDALDALQAKGKGVWGQARCSICHARKGVSGPVGNAPDLGDLASKIRRDWLYRWIARPRAYFPDTRMPHYRLEDYDVRALVEYMLRDPDFTESLEARPPEDPAAIPTDPATLSRGRELVGTLGCAGCHTIPGLEDSPPVGPDLSRFGEKHLDHLDYGAMRHDRPDRAEWARLKLESPRRFGPGLQMPHFLLDEAERGALVVALLSLRRSEVPADYHVAATWPPFEPEGPAGELMEDLRCFSCHTIRNRGATYATPLTLAGTKLRPDWIESFLRVPDVVKPQKEQMPRFSLSEGEARTLAQYLSTVLRDDRRVAGSPREEVLREGDREAGRGRFHEEGCQDCHQTEGPGKAVGPDLSRVGRRMNARALYAQVLDPGLLGSACPPRQGLTATDARNVSAWLLSLGEGQPSPSAQAPFRVSSVLVGVVPFGRPEEMASRVEPLAGYLSRELGLAVQVEIPQDFRTFHERLFAGAYGVALANPLQYVRAHETAGYEAVAAVAGAPFVGQIVSLVDGPVRSPEDLRGRKIAFAHPAAWAAAVLTREVLRERHGLDVMREATPVFAGTQRKALDLLLAGEVEAAGVLPTEIELLPEDSRLRLRVVVTSFPHPQVPVMVHPDLPASLRKAVRAAFVGLSPSGASAAQVLAGTAWKGFEETTDGAYDDVRQLMDRYGLPGEPHGEEFLWR